MDNTIKIAPIVESLDSFIKNGNYSSIAVLVDENTEAHCLEVLNLSQDYKLINIQSGEINKTLTTCQHIWQEMTDAAFDRHALMINLGGGVIGDMGGFCAATYKRGIDFVNIPTTLLSMVDASVGGKLGIDFGSFKNHIGLFQSPQAVLIDPVFLKTLPERQLKSGFAEVIKHALITSQEDWEKITQFDLVSGDLKSLIRRAVEIKSNVVEQDWKEQGLRKSLNFGHTIGHAIESYYLEDANNDVLHGEAVAAGMICELYLSKSLGFNNDQRTQIEAYILRQYGKLVIDEKNFGEISTLATQDKKNQKGEIRGVLLNAIGDAAIDSVLSKDQIAESLQYYNSLDI